MLFSSPIFFLFFAAYFSLHLLLPARFRLSLVIVGSTVFYGYWNVSNVWLPFALIAATYFGVLWMENAAEGRARDLRLAAIVVGLLIPLVFFKYADFFYRLVAQAFALPERKIVGLALPLGISFITFTLLAYAVDVYRKRFPRSVGSRCWQGVSCFSALDRRTHCAARAS